MEDIKKWTDFIRSGEDKAMVRIHILDNTEKYVIQRVVMRGKTPKLSLLKPQEEKFRNVSRKTIEELMARLNIDPNNVFSFMSQGNIDSIKDFKEETLCNFVETGIGLKTYRDQILNQKAKIEELNKKISSLIARKENLTYQIVELEPRLKRLEQKKKYTAKLRLLNDELLLAKHDIIKQEIVEFTKQLGAIQEKQRNLNEEIQNENQQFEEYSHDLKEIQDERANIIQQSASLKSQIEINKSKLDMMTSEKNEIAEKITQLGNKIRTFQIENTSSQVELQKATLNYKKIQNNIELESENLSKHQEKQTHLLKVLHNHQQQLYDLQSEMNELNRNQDNLNNLIENHSQIEQEIAEKLKEIKDINHDLQNYKWFMKNPRPDLQKRMVKLVSEYNASIEEKNARINILQTEYDALIHSIESIKKSVYHRSMPKPKQIQAMIDEIKSRKVACYGPLIDLITFDEIYQQAVESIFTSRILFGFIAKNQEAFQILKNIAVRNNAFCNLYLERDLPLSKLPDIQVDRSLGVFGYLASKIEPIVQDPAINKVIYSVAGKTLIVKDQIVGTKYIQKYNYQNWIVTLDGEQIRPKKYVVESRPLIKRKNEFNFANVAQAKQKLQALIFQAESNRDEILQFKNSIQETNRKLQILQNRLFQIDSLLVKYKRREIGTVRKNKLIHNRELAFEKIEKVKQQITLIEQKIGKMKSNLPEDILDIQSELESIPILIKKVQDRIKEFQNLLHELNEAKSKIDIRIQANKSHIMLLQQEKEKLEQKLQSSDSKFYEYFQENIKLKKLLEKMNSSHSLLQETIVQLNERLEESRNRKDSLHVEFLNLSNNQEKCERLIEERESKILIIEEKFSEESLKISNIRDISTISTDIALVEKFLSNYYDVSDQLLEEKQSLEESIIRIVEKRSHLEQEISAAQLATEKIEGIYYTKFNNSINILETSINNKLKTAKLNFSTKFNLIGDIHQLGLEIKSLTINKLTETIYPLSALSGGQRSMVGICLMLSLNELKPSPLNIYDECDMFLDEKNSQTVASLIREMTLVGIQFIILMPSKNRDLLHLAKKVIGISRNGKNGPSTVHYSRIFSD
jgi:structural maintenance of chromosome 3 (chondroitin sulfate proteoglycan 6)